MKNAKTFLVGLLLLGNIVASGTALATDGVISKDELTAGSYCHMKFPAMQEWSLGTDHPTLKSSASGDVVDFYGPCNENPTGEDQVHAQRLDFQQRHDQD
jgi:hypothetical protein